MYILVYAGSGSAFSLNRPDRSRPPVDASSLLPSPPCSDASSEPTGMADAALAQYILCARFGNITIGHGSPVTCLPFPPEEIKVFILINGKYGSYLWSCRLGILGDESI